MKIIERFGYNNSIHNCCENFLSEVNSFIEEVTKSFRSDACGMEPLEFEIKINEIVDHLSIWVIIETNHYIDYLGLKEVIKRVKKES